MWTVKSVQFGAVKPSMSLSSLQRNHVICFSHRVCITSQNHSGTIFAVWLSSSGLLSLLLQCFTLFNHPPTESRIAAFGFHCLACRPAGPEPFHSEDFKALKFLWPRWAVAAEMVPHANTDTYRRLRSCRQSWEAFIFYKEWFLTF